MNSRKRSYKLALPFLILLLASLACGTGYRTSSSLYGESGKVRIQLKEGDGVFTNSVEINEDWSWDLVSATVTFSVSEGSCLATLSGDENTSIVLTAAAGNPSEAAGDLVTDSFGDVELVTDCTSAKDLDLTIDFTRR
jgi:hypothetical protein